MSKVERALPVHQGAGINDAAAAQAELGGIWLFIEYVIATDGQAEPAIAKIPGQSRIDLNQGIELLKRAGTSNSQ